MCAGTISPLREGDREDKRVRERERGGKGESERNGGEGGNHKRLVHNCCLLPEGAITWRC